MEQVGNQLMVKKITLVVLLSVILSVILVTTILLLSRQPKIISVNSNEMVTGGTLIISGEHLLSRNSNSNKVFLDKQKILPVYIMSWSDTEIVLEIPYFNEFALVSVKTRWGKSESHLIVDQSRISLEQISSPYFPGYPYIQFIDKAQGRPGEIITLEGSQFGSSRFSAYVMINKKDNGQVTYPLYPDYDDYIKVDKDDYLSWSDDKISFYLPNGAKSGFLYVVTRKGNSNPVYFEVVGEAGDIIVSDKLKFSIYQSVDIKSEWQENANLTVWIPEPVIYNRQNNLTILSESDTSVLVRENLSLYEITEPDITISRSYVIDCYNIEVVLDPYNISNDYHINRPLYKKYTQASNIIPSDQYGYRALAYNVTVTGYNPYQKAKLIMEHVKNEFSWTEFDTSSDLLESYQNSLGDSHRYSEMFVTLCRAVGIPARKISGILVSDSLEVINHHWAEFFIENIGWIPVDPAIYDDMEWETVKDRTFYFGGVDNHHIAFSRGIVESVWIDPESDIIQDVSQYSQQYFISEYSGLKNEPQIIMNPVEITGVW